MSGERQDTEHVRAHAGGKYEVLLVPDPDAGEEDLQPRRDGAPRIAFQIMPASAVLRGPAPRWQAFAAGGLFLFTAATCLQLALVANVSRLPKARTPPHPPCPSSPLLTCVRAWRT